MVRMMINELSPQMESEKWYTNSYKIYNQLHNLNMYYSCAGFIQFLV